MKTIARVFALLSVFLVSGLASAGLQSISVSVTSTPARVAASGTGYTSTVHFANTGLLATVFLVKNATSGDAAPSAADCLAGIPIAAGTKIETSDPNGVDLSTYFVCCAALSTSTLAVSP